MRTTSWILRAAFAQDLPALAQPTCSTEDDTRSRREGTHVRRRRYSEGCTRATCGPGHQETGRACPEPKVLEPKTFRVENGVLVGPEMGRINAHNTRTSGASSVQRMMDNLNANKHAHLIPIWSLWSRCVACGWRHENQVATSSRCRSLVSASPL